MILVVINRHQAILTGELHKSSNGGLVRKVRNYPVHIVLHNPGSPYPVLVGDRFTESLGWASLDDLTYP